MAEGADEEEIQFLRTVSDAVRLFLTITKLKQPQCRKKKKRKKSFCVLNCS